MKKLLQQYAAYNLWANQQLFNTMLALPQQTQQQEVVSSFPSLYKTVFHMLGAESLWWQRLQLVHTPVPPDKTVYDTAEKVCTVLLQQSSTWATWVSGLDDATLQKNIVYKNLAGQQFEQPVHELLLHIFNHSTYHRGQLVMMFRQLGVEKIPQTDFAYWLRVK